MVCCDGFLGNRWGATQKDGGHWVTMVIWRKVGTKKRGPAFNFLDHLRAAQEWPFCLGFQSNRLLGLFDSDLVKKIALDSNRGEARLPLWSAGFLRPPLE